MKFHARPKGISPSAVLSSFIVLLCIATKEAHKLYFFLVFSESVPLQPWYTTLWAGLTALFAPLTGYFLDRYHPKTVLLTTMLLSVISVGCLELGYFLIAVICNGIFANVTVAGRALYSYMHARRPGVRVFAETYAVQALPWIAICIDAQIYSQYVKKIAVILSIVAIVAIVYLLEVTFSKARIHKERIGRKIRLIRGERLCVLVAFFFSESAYQLIQYHVDSSFQEKVVSDAFSLLGMGVFLGAILHWVIHFNARLKVLFMAYVVSLGVFVSGYISYAYFPSSALDNFSYYLPFAIAGGFGLPLVFALCTKKMEMQARGFIVGSLESVMAIADFLGPLLVWGDIFTFPTMIVLLGVSTLCTYRPRFYREVV